MESEMETDTPEIVEAADAPDAADVVDLPDVSEKPRTKRRGPYMVVAKLEDVPVNWARKPHASDRIPIPSTENLIVSEDRTRIDLEDQSSYAVNEFVYVEDPADPPPAHRDDIDYGLPKAYRIARIMAFDGPAGALEVKVNWFYRPSELMHRSHDSRELYASFVTGVCSVVDFRGKCTVSNRLDQRNLARYCEKPSRFWFSKLFHHITRRVFDVLPLAAMKSLAPEVTEKMSLNASAVVVPSEHSKRLTEPFRKRKRAGNSATQPRSDSESPDEVATEEHLQLKAAWPFRWLDVESLTVDLSPGVPKNAWKATADPSEPIHVDVPDWPGNPMVYYTLAVHNPASGEFKKLRLLQADENNPDIWNVDTSLPWVQKMPRGYIARGVDATSTEKSLPLPGLGEFVRTCQDNYSANLDLEPHNLNFIAACCRAFTASDGDQNRALEEVSRFTRRSIGEPELTATEVDAFEKAMNPFLGLSWHDVFRAVQTKPIADLSQYFWTKRPDSAIVPVEDVFWGSDPPSDATDIECAVCDGTAPDSKHLLGYVPVPVRDASSKIVLCPRCARLWCRYQTRWLPANRVEELERKLGNEDTFVEPELVEDAKAFKAEDERRTKRRNNAREKKEAQARRREEVKQAKAKARQQARASGQRAKSRKGHEKDAIDRASVELEDNQPFESGSESGSGPDDEGDRDEPGPDAGAEYDNSLVGEDPTQDDTEDDGVTETQVSRRKAAAPLLNLNPVDDILNKLSEDAASDLNSVPQSCVVCGQFDASMAQHSCASCGLNVHTACYGPGVFEGPGAWVCDCCVNARTGLGLDSFYQCALCPPKQPSYIRWLSGEEGPSASDALKGTIDKTWCHLRCAVWTPGASFLRAEHLDGVDLHDVVVEKKPCSICLRRSDAEKVSRELAISTASSGGVPAPKSTHSPQVTEASPNSPLLGVRVHCDICGEAFHVSCAAEEEYIFGMSQSDPPKPVIRCKKHGLPQLRLSPMSYVDLKTGLTPLQIYCRQLKQSSRKTTITAAERVKRTLLKEPGYAIEGLAPTALLLAREQKPEMVARTDVVCSACHLSKASYWLSQASGYVCALCVRGKYWFDLDLSALNSAELNDGLISLVDKITGVVPK